MSCSRTRVAAHLLICIFPKTFPSLYIHLIPVMQSLNMFLSFDLLTSWLLMIILLILRTQVPRMTLYKLYCTATMHTAATNHLDVSPPGNSSTWQFTNIQHMISKSIDPKIKSQRKKRPFKLFNYETYLKEAQYLSILSLRLVKQISVWPHDPFKKHFLVF